MKPTQYRSTPWLLLFSGVIGLIAAFTLTQDKIAILSDPSYIPSCNINPVLSCGSVIITEQASVFGFPNPIIGLISFSVVITLAVLLVARVVLPNWVWLGLNLGALGGLAFAVWLIFQSLYVIDALCPWCMVAWICIRYFQFTALGVCRCDILGDFKFDLYQLDGLLARSHLIRS